MIVFEHFYEESGGLKKTRYKMQCGHAEEASQSLTALKLCMFLANTASTTVTKQ